VKGWKEIFQENGARRQEGVAIFRPDKADFKNNTSQMKQRRSLHIDKGDNPSRVFNSCKCIRTK
jgi:hypothetical protein